MHFWAAAVHDTAQRPRQEHAELPLNERQQWSIAIVLRVVMLCMTVILLAATWQDLMLRPLVNVAP